VLSLQSDSCLTQTKIQRRITADDYEVQAAVFWVLIPYIFADVCLLEILFHYSGSYVPI
jgi:hypothetical protein